jgi:SAM-dependent methyltransferase
MAPQHQIHDRRDRADAFGAVAEDYDRYRPGYPAALIDDLVALRPSTVLDVGCGTGKAARLLAGRGLSVLGVEPDPRMAAVARERGVPVEVAAFETWDERARRFDLITCGQAWHWIDPAAGAPKANRLLTARGTLALFWNYDSVDGPARAAMDAVYDRYAPHLRSTTRNDQRRDDLGPFVADLKSYGGFADVSTRTYRWERVEPVADLVARVGTHSDHLLLGATRLAELRDALVNALTALGATVRSTGATYTILARAGDKAPWQA